MTPHEKLRSLIDRLNKRPSYPTGGDGRMTAEAINTSAMARNLAKDRYKITGPVKTMSLKDLQVKK